MTLLELLIAITILAILIAGAGFQLKGLIQRAKISAAKSTIVGFGLSLSMIRNDTGLYPEQLSDVQRGDSPFEPCPGKWYGPYGETLSRIDPWGNEYDYKLVEGVIFGPGTFEKHTPPIKETCVFSAPSEKGTVIIHNHGITAGRVWLNGEEIVSPDDFKQHEDDSIIEVVELLSSNILQIRLTSNPAREIELKITSATSQNSDPWVRILA